MSVTANIADMARLTNLLEAMGADITTIRWVLIPGEPHRKMRPKFARRGKHTVTYQPDEDVAAEAKTGAILRRSVPEAFTGNIAVVGIFYRSSRQVIDTDNLIKHVCDSGNGISWIDDSQATATAGFIELDPARPRSIVGVAHHPATSMKRGTDFVGRCRTCGEVFPLEGRAPDAQYCSRGCASRSRRKDFIPFEVIA